MIVGGEESRPGEETATHTLEGHVLLGDHRLIGLSGVYGTDVTVETGASKMGNGLI